MQVQVVDGGVRAQAVEAGLQGRVTAQQEGVQGQGQGTAGQDLQGGRYNCTTKKLLILGDEGATSYIQD